MVLPVRRFILGSAFWMFTCGGTAPEDGPEPPSDPYPVCEDDDEAASCLTVGFCNRVSQQAGDPPCWSVCNRACATDADCPPMPGASNMPSCEFDDLVGDETCVVPCSDDVDCPTGMECLTFLDVPQCEWIGPGQC